MLPGRVSLAFRHMWFLGVLGLSAPILAATPTLSPSGVPVRWESGRLELAGNPVNRSGLSESEVFAAAVRGLRRWELAGGGRIGFDYWQGRDARVFEPNSNLNGQSGLYFASSSNVALDPQVLGLTQVWFNSETGRIIETDIVLNDTQYTFTTRPTDTTGFGSGVTTGTTVYLENVLTHELGHAFGLSHSGVMQSTMLFMEAPDEAHLGCDDQSGIRGAYGTPGAGAIRVRVLTPGGAPLFGAQVQAISREAGTLLGSALSNSQGVARIGGLSPGTYDLMVEPYIAGPSALPQYYSGTSGRVCSGAYFSRTFRRESGTFALAPVGVAEGGEADAGSITVRCSGDSVSSLELPVVSPAQSVVAGAGVFESGQRVRIQTLGGDLRVKLLSFSLYSPATLRATLWTERGTRVAARESFPVYRSESGFAVYDSELGAAALPAGVYFLELSAQSVPIQYYPAGMLSRDPLPIFMLQVGLGQSAASHPRCRQDEAFAAYQSPPGDPPRHSISGTDAGTGGACGRIRFERPRDGGQEALAIAGHGLWWLSLFCIRRRVARLAACAS